MAYISKRGKGWRAQVATNGLREAATFSTKGEATAWAAETETRFRSAVSNGIILGKSMEDAFDRYEKEVSVHKRGFRWEAIRMNAIANCTFSFGRFGKLPIAEITPAIIGAWRDHRLTVDKVSGSTVNRDMNLLSHVFTIARKEWRWIADSPTKDVRRPKEALARSRLISDDEIERLCFATGFNEARATTKCQKATIAFLLAIETAMRAGELCKLKRSDIVGRVATLRETKNGTVRQVPLSKRALELLEFLPPNEDGSVLGMLPSSLDANFRKYRALAGIEGLHFHDTRHEAITRLAKKMNVLELARMVGHKDLRELQTYFNQSAESMAALLD